MEAIHHGERRFANPELSGLTTAMSPDASQGYASLLKL